MSLENTNFITSALKDEVELNELHRISSLLFVPYKEFYHSSNKLAKACQFQVPLLTGPHYMGEVVSKNNLGISVQNVDSQVELTNGITTILKGNIIPNWDAYLQINNLNYLKKVLSSL
jgi:hypothetical protein